MRAAQGAVWPHQAAAPSRKAGVYKAAAKEKEKSGTESVLNAKKNVRNRYLLGFAALFLAGYLPGIWLGRNGGSALGSQVAAYYMDKQNFASVASVFTGQFAAAFLQISLVMLCGLCAVGIPVLALFFGCRGVYLGLCASSVSTGYGAKGLVLYWLLAILPDLIIFLLVLSLASYAARLSSALCSQFFGAGVPKGLLTVLVKRLLVRAAAILILSAVAAALGAALSVFLAGVLL